MAKAGGSKTQEGTAGARKVVLAALLGNLAVAATKFVAFAVSGSTAMLTEAIHSVVDTADQLLLLVGQRRAGRPADAEHPFGYGMEVYFWSFVVAMMIFLIGGVVGISEGVERLLHPAPVRAPLLNFAVLAAAAVFEGLSFRTAYREFRRIVRGRAVRLPTFLRLSKDPSVFATLLEDGAALTGLALAALGVAGSARLGWHRADGAASILIGLLLVAIAGFLSNLTRSLITGESAAPAVVEEIMTALKNGRRAGRAASARTLHLGPQNILVVVRWAPADVSTAELQAGLAEAKAAVMAAEPRVRDVLFDLESPLES
jgi:cation diffusion facilitator family transporter